MCAGKYRLKAVCVEYECKAGALYAALTLRMESACETRTHQVKKNEAKGCSVTVDFWAK